jgi:hypothetical protein
MAAGAIPPPLFFERRRLREQFCSVQGILFKNTPDNKSASITRVERSGEVNLARRDRSLPKDI